MQCFSPAVNRMKVRGRSLPFSICKRALGLRGGGRREMEKERCLETFASVSSVSRRSPFSPPRTNASIADDLK